jgi:hypothetical protein
VLAGVDVIRGFSFASKMVPRIFMRRGRLFGVRFLPIVVEPNVVRLLIPLDADGLSDILRHDVVPDYEKLLAGFIG